MDRDLEDTVQRAQVKPDSGFKFSATPKRQLTEHIQTLGTIVFLEMLRENLLSSIHYMQY